MTSWLVIFKDVRGAFWQAALGARAGGVAEAGCIGYSMGKLPVVALIGGRFVHLNFARRHDALACHFFKLERAPA